MRPDILNPLFVSIDQIKGVGPKLQKPLEKLGIGNVADLLFHLPSGFIERRKIAHLDEASEGDQIIVQVTITDVKKSHGRGPTRLLAQDGIGNIMAIVFFGRHNDWAVKQLPLGETRYIAGKLERYGDMLQIIHPDHIAAEDSGLEAVEAVYPCAKGLTSKRLTAMVADAKAYMPQLNEWIEPGLLEREKWPEWNDALSSSHQGPNEAAHQRLAYDEILAGQLAFALLRRSNRRQKGQALAGDGRLRDALHLDYKLTGAQERAIAEILQDLEQPVPMLRLLQGDVGAGKTIVAVMAMLAAIEAGGQAVLLAPTEILSKQHFATFNKLLQALPINVELLTGRDKGKVREAKLMGIADGSINLVIGTHALFQDAVIYNNLALAVIDEQHRFGVNQRLLLSQKGKLPPHMLTMTATPIPRTLTLSQFGEMDVSRLDEKPPGRQPIETLVMSDSRLGQIIDGLERHIAGGGQAYWVCPLVNESDLMDAVAVEERYAILRERFGNRVEMVHGQMPADQKDAAMERFAEGESAILCATTVIEVGVDVPNATLMIVESAERFGLAQLHQLRGRVGRGSDKSRCLLLRSQNLSETARARLALMRSSQDGFFLAEEDLRLRGAGELLGTRQSGEVGYKLARPEQVHALISIANDDARLLITQDENLEKPRGQAARTLLYLFQRDQGIRLLRGG